MTAANDEAELPFQVGDLVTRDGTDIHRVIEADDYGCGNIVVECIKESLRFPEPDGSLSEPLYKVGDVEPNLARRYSLVQRVRE